MAGLEFDWIDDWAQLPDDPATRAAWPHAGIVVTPEGDVVTFLPTGGGLLFLQPDGHVRRTVRIPIAEAHGITFSASGERRSLWLADASMQKRPDEGYAANPAQTPSQVVNVDFDGGVRDSLDPPPARFNRERRYCPTSVAVAETAWGGDGSVWVADGYGASFVHRYRADGTYHSTLSGEDGAGRFDTPHTLFLDRRRAEPELYVADRANARIQAYDLDGRFRRAIGEGVLASPTGVAVHGDRLFIVEFKPPRLTILDADDRLVMRLFEQPNVPEEPGWPNALGPDGSPARSNRLRPRRLNSPHAVAIDSAGNLYITEWLIGGRLTKLTPSSSIAG